MQIEYLLKNICQKYIQRFINAADSLKKSLIAHAPKGLAYWSCLGQTLITHQTWAYQIVQSSSFAGH